MQRDLLHKKCFDILTPSRSPGWVKGQNIGCMAFYASFLLIWYAIWLLSEKNFLTFWPLKGVYKGKIFTSVLLYASLSLIWYAHDHILKKMILYQHMWPLQQGKAWPKGQNLNQLGRGPLDGATFQISRPCGFRQEDFFMLSLYKPM